MKKYIYVIMPALLTAALVYATETGGTVANATTSPAGMVASIYQFALIVAGILAFGQIVYAGIQYTISAGNPSKQSDAKDRITQALLGLLLLFGAVLILRTINPAITGGINPLLSPSTTPPPSTGGNTSNCTPACTPPDQCLFKDNTYQCVGPGDM